MALATLEQSPELEISTDISLDRNPVLVYLGSLSPGSRRTMLQALDVIAGYVHPRAEATNLAWWNLRYQHVALIRSRLAEVYATASVNKMLAALRGVLRECWRLDMIPEAEFRKAIDVRGVRGQSLPPGRALSPGEVRALFEACAEDGSPSGIRDAAIIAVLFGCGLRRSEVCGLDVSDIHEEFLAVRQGKGHKDRTVPIATGAASAINDWLKIRGDATGPLFVPVDKSGQLTYRRLSGQATYNLLRKRASEACLSHFTPHDLRRTFVSALLEAGADLATVAKLAGHSSVTTTARYDRRGEKAKRQAVDLLNVPYNSTEFVKEKLLT